MTTTTDADPVVRVTAIIGAGGDADRGQQLARLARLIDARSGPARPSSPLVVPRLDELAGGRGELDDRRDGELAAALDLLDPGAGPALLGQVHEALLDAGDRRRGGSYYTPDDVARGLVDEVFARLSPPTTADDGGSDRRGRHPGVELVHVCDPALGGGAFLLAAADALVARGVAIDDVVERCLWGSDVDPVAVAVTEAALILWARARGVDVARVNVACADALLAGVDAWPGAPASGFDAVIGNPPFLSQLGSGTSRDADAATKLRARWGRAVYRYTDTAAVFLLAATELAAPGGVVAMIVPVAVLVTGDADRLRTALLDRSVPEHLWIARDDVFGLGVRVCAPFLRVAPEPGSAIDGQVAARAPDPRAVGVTRSLGRAFEPIDAREVDLDALRSAGTWGELVADVFGVPALVSTTPRSGRLGDFCVATAGFRDQYYGLRPYVVEAADAPDRPVAMAGERGAPGARRAKLVTSGLIDPARLTWGARPCRFDGRRWVAPAVDLDRLDEGDPALAAWAAARLVPKVVVATQTRVLEAAVDVDGEWFPSVPTIAVVAEPGRLWDAAAVVLAPPTTAWAMNRHIGAALSADALKVSAKQVLEAPLPVDRAAWTLAVGYLRAASSATNERDWREHLRRFGEEMTRAYAAPGDVLAWWFDRLPRWR